MRAAALLLLAASLQAQPKLDFEHYQLPNGIHVILHVDRKIPAVHMNLRFRVGSKDEPPGRSGFAHFFEHMMFEGNHFNADAGLSARPTSMPTHTPTTPTTTKPFPPAAWSACCGWNQIASRTFRRA